MRPEMKFVGRMRALFGMPDADANAVIDEYTAVLAGQTEATLDRAADHLARTHKFRNWPTVAECLDAVAAAKRTAKASGFGLEPIDDFDGWWAERMARVAIAKTDREINDQIAQVEPYAHAGWILRSRLPEIVEAGNARRKQWHRDQATEVARRQTGEVA